MKVRTILLSIMLCLFSSQAMSSSSIGDMQLIGKGTAYYLKFIRVYDASLYTNGPLNNKDILSGDVSKCLLLDYNVSLGREDFITAANTVLARQFTVKELEAVSDELALLHESYVDVTDGDMYSLCYDRDESRTSLSLNDQELVTIDSEPFASVYFGIWLGATAPLDETLRNDLLGRK